MPSRRVSFLSCPDEGVQQETGRLDSAFSNISVANYTLGRAETRVDKGALVAGHAPPSASGRRRKQCGRTDADGDGGRAGGHADNMMKSVGNPATKWLQLCRPVGDAVVDSCSEWSTRSPHYRNRCPVGQQPGALAWRLSAPCTVTFVLIRFTRPAGAQLRQMTTAFHPNLPRNIVKHRYAPEVAFPTATV